MRSRSYVWWPGLDEQLEAVVSECRCCLAVRNSPAVLKDSTWPTPQTPWERLHADFAGPIDPGRKMLLVMADASTKWPEIFLMDTTTSARTIEKLRTVFDLEFRKQSSVTTAPSLPQKNSKNLCPATASSIGWAPV